MCKDKFNIKRRVPFQKDPKITEFIDSCTIYIESVSDELSIHHLSQFVKSYKPRDIRVKDGFAFVELQTPESVEAIK